MRRIVIVIVALLAIVFVLVSLTELESILNALQKSDLFILVIALGIEMVCLLNTAATFEALYRLVGMRENHGRMFLMTSAANFINMVAPSGGIGGMAVFMDHARRQSQSTGRVMAVGMLYLLYEYASLFIILIFGFYFIHQQGKLNWEEWLAAGFLVALAGTVTVLAWLGSRSPAKLGRLLERLALIVNRLVRPVLGRDIFASGDAHNFSRDMAEGLSSLQTSGKNLTWPLLFTLNNKALQMCVLACSFLALKTPFNVGTIVGGFSVSQLFFYATPTPSGVGFVEGILPSALAGMGIPFAEAILITLAYRAVTLWFPFATGAVTFRILQRGHRTVSA